MRLFKRKPKTTESKTALEVARGELQEAHTALAKATLEMTKCDKMLYDASMKLGQIEATLKSEANKGK